MFENVELIKSTPIQAAQRVHSMVIENLWQSERAATIAKKILETEKITLSRATLIARTEISRARTAFVEARALQLGSEGYIWNTVLDGLARPSHQDMEGRFVRWDSPPTLNKMTGHAGQFPNCRCYPNPVI